MNNEDEMVGEDGTMGKDGTVAKTRRWAKIGWWEKMGWWEKTGRWARTGRKLEEVDGWMSVLCWNGNGNGMEMERRSRNGGNGGGEGEMEDEEVRGKRKDPGSCGPGSVGTCYLVLGLICCEFVRGDRPAVLGRFEDSRPSAPSLLGQQAGDSGWWISRTAGRSDWREGQVTGGREGWAA